MSYLTKFAPFEWRPILEVDLKQGEWVRGEFTHVVVNRHDCAVYLCRGEDSAKKLAELRNIEAAIQVLS